MTETKISDLTAITTAATGDKIIVTDVSDTDNTKIITLTNLFKSAIEGLIDHGNLTGLSTGADHSYIDQDVTQTGTPTFGDTLKLGDGTAQDIKLIFDDGSNRTLKWDDSEGRFDLNHPLVANVGGSNQGFRVVSTDTGSYLALEDDTTSGTNNVMVGAVGDTLWLIANGNFSWKIDGTSLISNNFSTEDLSLDDAGRTGATEQDWIEVSVGGNTGYIRVYAAK